MVPVRAVHVAVLDLFLRRGAHVDDRRVEAQALARELVVAVEHGAAVRDVRHAEHLLLPSFSADR